MSNLQSHELLEQYQQGRSDAATTLFDRYVTRLVALARSRVGPKLKRKIDPEDVVQSAYRSFFVHARNKEYLLNKSGDLWRLLASITLHKLYTQVERYSAAKRTLDREQPTDALVAGAATTEPSAAEVASLVEEIQIVLSSLTEVERDVLTATLQGESVAEIAESTGKSARTIRRLLQRARQQLEQRLMESQFPRGYAAEVSSGPAASPHAPLRYSDYVLQQMLGSGGMGKVFRALEKTTGRTVAIKALHKARQSDPRAVSRFVHEAHILATLRHPNIVGVQGIGQFPSGGYFLALDYVDGTDLQHRVNRGPLPYAEAVWLVREVAAAVRHAHDMGVVHCDLKPANVLLSRTNQVFVTDFGFAYMIAEATPHAASNIGGTAGYMAPEILHLHQPPTPAADIYALGALLATLITGKSPARGLVPADNIALPDPLIAVYSQCLAERPKDRFASVEQLEKALVRLAQIA